MMLGTALALIVAFSVTVAEEAKKENAKVTCPVAGKEIKIADAKVVSYRKSDVYVCCDGCKGKLEKDSAKYATKANKQLVETKQYKQVKCPLGGRAVNPKQTVKVGGVEVGLCCGNCKKKAEGASGDDQIALLFADKAFEKGFEKVEAKK